MITYSWWLESMVYALWYNQPKAKYFPSPFSRCQTILLPQLLLLDHNQSPFFLNVLDFNLFIYLFINFYFFFFWNEMKWMWLNLTRMPQTFMRTATSRPMRPNPRIAKVLPNNSVPLYSLRSQRPSFILCPAGTMGRAKAPINIQVNSQAEIELPPGVLKQANKAKTLH